MEKLRLLELTMKTVMLILLATFQRGQTMLALSLDAMHRDDTKISFRLKLTDLKQGRQAISQNFYNSKSSMIQTYVFFLICVITLPVRKILGKLRRY